MNPTSSDLSHTEFSQTAALIFQKVRSRYPRADQWSLEAARFENQPTLFYSHNLETDYPQAARYLFELAQPLNFQVIRDRRSDASEVSRERRGKLALILGLGSLLSLEPVLADDLERINIGLSAHNRGTLELEIDNTADGITIRRRTLETRELVRGMQRLEHCMPSDPPADTLPCIRSRNEQADRIESFLLDRLGMDRKQEFSEQDLRLVAEYFSQFPEVGELVDRLRDHHFKLIPTRNRWMTQADIRNSGIADVRVYFSLHSAAQTHFMHGCGGQPACTTSPADALLHELIHVSLIYRQPGQFMTSAANTGYPHAHENEVIAEERRLYEHMTRTDGLPRPQRRQHAGHLVAVSSPVCWGE